MALRALLTLLLVLAAGIPSLATAKGAMRRRSDQKTPIPLPPAVSAGATAALADAVANQSRPTPLLAGPQADASCCKKMTLTFASGR